MINSWVDHEAIEEVEHDFPNVQTDKFQIVGYVDGTEFPSGTVVDKYMIFAITNSANVVETYAVPAFKYDYVAPPAP